MGNFSGEYIPWHKALVNDFNHGHRLKGRNATARREELLRTSSLQGTKPIGTVVLLILIISLFWSHTKSKPFPEPPSPPPTFELLQLAATCALCLHDQVDAW